MKNLNLLKKWYLMLSKTKKMFTALVVIIVLIILLEMI